MKLTESLALALKNIVSSKVRTLLTMLGIIIGVAAVIVIVGLGNGLETYVTDSFASMGTNTLTVSVMSRGSTRTLDAEDMYQIVADNSQYLDLCSPTVPMMGYVKIGSETVDSTTSQGVSEDYFSIAGLEVSSGRGLQYSDMATRAKVCVIGAYLNEAYFGGNAVGQTLRVGGQSLTVVGVLARQGDTLEEGGSDDCLYLPYTTAERISGEASSYTITMQNEDYIDQMFAWGSVDRETLYYDSFTQAAEAWLDQIEVPSEYRPDYDNCSNWYRAKEDNSEILFFWDAKRNLLYCLESFL